jgi:3-isopropylmalate/(R)-2-methylmalate dehydratase large subunit
MVTFGFKPDQVKPAGDMADTPGGSGLHRLLHQRPHRATCASPPSPDRKADQWQGAAIVSPATPEVYRPGLAEGLIIRSSWRPGFCVTNPTCGACLGMSNGVLAEGEVCAATTNRNFNGRMGKGGMVHLMSPATAAATAIAQRIAV